MDKLHNGEGLFDPWPDRYDAWFETPVGKLVKEYENEVVLDLLAPAPGELILDAGCGTGIFTLDLLASGAKVVGLDLSLPMLRRAGKKFRGYPFRGVGGDLLSLPFSDRVFDKVVSVTALEFVQDGKAALRELSRVTKRKGSLVVATLNALSPWAARRRAEAEERRDSLFKGAVFRTPGELEGCLPQGGVVRTRTAVHFLKDADPQEARRVEREGRERGLPTGAFLAVHWENR
jgi:ubiquinone/menaquinone biosynthesis C-methylase UbiE